MGTGLVQCYIFLYKYGKYNSIGRVSDCGSGSSWFEPRYLPLIMWNIVSNNTIKLVYTNKILFLIKSLLVLRKLFSNIIKNSIFFNKFILFTQFERHTNQSTQFKVQFKSMFYMDKSPLRVLNHKTFNSALYKTDVTLTKTLFDYFLYVNT